jgi:hypothetical protein
MHLQPKDSFFFHQTESELSLTWDQGENNGVRGKENERDRACSPHRKLKQNLKMVVPNPQFYIEELGE